MFKSLRTVRRIILSGTPIQNDLGEFHAMVRMRHLFYHLADANFSKANFCNPGLLGELQSLTSQGTILIE